MTDPALTHDAADDDSNRGAPVALIVLLALLAYANTLTAGFTFDDTWVVVNNTRVHSLDAVGEIFATPYWGQSERGGLYRPVTLVTFALNHAVHGLEPFGYHLVNVLLQAAVSVMAFLLARRLWSSILPAVAVGAWFALHPIHTEAVAGVVGRAELLAALGVFGSLLLGWRAYDRGGDGRVAVATLLVAVLLALALLSKEIALVFVPLWLAVLVFAVRARPASGGGGRLAWIIAIAGIAVTVGFFAAKWSVTGSLVVPPDAIHHVSNPLAQMSTLERLPTALAVLGSNIASLVAPITLSYDYSFEQIPQAHSLADPRVVTALLAALAGGIAMLVGLRYRLAAAFGAAWFAVTVLPVANIVAPIGTIRAERLLYLPSFGFLVFAVDVIWRLTRRRPRAFIAIVAVVSLGFGVRTCIRNLDWQSDRTLFESGVLTAPDSSRAHCELGKLLYNESRSSPEGDRVELEDRAIAALERGLEIWDEEDPVAHLALAFLYEGRFRLGDARTHFAAARRIRADVGIAWLGELRCLERLGKLDEVREVRTALFAACAPGDARLSDEFWRQVAAALQRVGDGDGARTAMARAAAAPTMDELERSTPYR